MGCFLGCFGGCKNHKRNRKQRRQVIPRDHQRQGVQKLSQATVSLEQGTPEAPAILVAEKRDKSEEQSSSSPITKKRVTFNSNVTTYEHVSVHESADSLTENDRIKQEKEEKTTTKLSQSSSYSEDDSTISSVGSYPPNHRYQNYRDSDESEDYDNEGSDLDDDDEEEEEEDYNDYSDDDDRIVCEKVWSESIPVESMESKTVVHSAEGEVESPMIMSAKEIRSAGMNRNARDRSVYVHPVLNPVENLSQWKAVKSKERTSQHKPQKENFTAYVDQYKKQKHKLKDQEQHSREMSVDASLSTWLVPGDDLTPTLPKKASSSGGHIKTIGVAGEKSATESWGPNSATSFDDRPILGALTVEELKQLSSASSTTTPRRSPCKSPEETPIIGTVGTYWNMNSKNKSTGSAEESTGSNSCNGIPNNSSKYREDERVKWYTTPFEMRLEKALQDGAIGA